jgi:hypothetical protein
MFLYAGVLYVCPGLLRLVFLEKLYFLQYNFIQFLPVIYLLKNKIRQAKQVQATTIQGRNTTALNVAP